MRFVKRGAVESYFIIIVIAAIVGFIAVLIFLGKLGFQNYGSNEVCSLSVLSRATTPSGTQNYVPLKCNTKKTCLTQGGDCGQFAGEDKVVREKLPEIAMLLQERLRKFMQMPSTIAGI